MAGGLPCPLLEELALTTDLRLPRYNLLISGATWKPKILSRSCTNPKEQVDSIAAENLALTAIQEFLSHASKDADPTTRPLILKTLDDAADFIEQLASQMDRGPARVLALRSSNASEQV